MCFSDIYAPRQRKIARFWLNHQAAQRATVIAGKGIAFFDFDGTLIHHDSLLPFLAQVAGWRVVLWAYAVSYGLSFFCAEKKERRTFIKDFVLRRVLAGKTEVEIDRAVDRLALWPHWILSTLESLCQHRENGYKIVIASGSLDLYLRRLLKDIPHDDIICTEMEWKDGLLTGNMKTANCVREEKARRVADYLKHHESAVDTRGGETRGGDTWGYGNAPHDLPMMALLKNQVIIK